MNHSVPRLPSCPQPLMAAAGLALENERLQLELHARLRELGMRAAVAAPIVVDGELWGAVAAASVGLPFPRDAEGRLGAFAELIGQAIANVDPRIKLEESRARIVQAAAEARQWIERDLHDGAQ